MNNKYLDQYEASVKEALGAFLWAKNAALGYKVVDMKGGILAWNEAGLPTTKIE